MREHEKPSPEEIDTNWHIYAPLRLERIAIFLG